MNIEKPYLPVLIIDSQVQAPGLYIEQKAVSVALEIEPAKGTVSKNILSILIEGHTPFLLLINSTNRNIPITTEMSELIKLCLFSKNYIRQDDSPVIAFIHQEESHPDRAADARTGSFISQLQLQGWPSIVRWELSSSLSFGEQVRKKTGTPLFLEQIDFDEDFLLNDFFSDPHYMGKYIFFRHTVTRSAGALEEEFFRLCESAIGRQSLFSMYLTNYLLAEKAGAAVENQNRILRERLNNAEHTIDIIRTKYKGDYDILFNWYQKEYEVLPLWYKRMGHIVKVITGKRTLRSLFNEDEKINNK